MNAAIQIRSRPMPKQFDLSKYPLDTKLTVPQRIANFLDWAAKNYPYQFVPYNLILKAVMGFSKTPMLKSSDVDNLRSKMTRVREILQAEYERELHTAPGSGARATVDSADTLKHSVPKRIQRVKAAKEALAKTAALVDPSKVPNTEEFKALKSWFNKDVHDVIKTLTSPEFEKKLALPSGAPVTEKKP